jgi:hypothetical protein
VLAAREAAITGKAFCRDAGQRQRARRVERAQFGMGMGRAQDCGVERAARSRQIVGKAAAAEQQVGVFQARQNGRSPLTVTRCMTRRWPW